VVGRVGTLHIPLGWVGVEYTSLARATLRAPGTTSSAGSMTKTAELPARTVPPTLTRHVAELSVTDTPLTVTVLLPSRMSVTDVRHQRCQC